jgi:phytoene synthase
VNRELKESYRHCASVARREARNFYPTFWLLPPEKRRGMCALYAFMRKTDDIADDEGADDAKRSALDSWSHELEAIANARFEGVWPGRFALADCVARYRIPVDLLAATIKGVRMDVDRRRYQTFDDLYDYCYHVASVVGISCLYIWGFDRSGDSAIRRAEACGVALQLTNILRDVREDAERGRVYLPAEDLDRFGVSVAELSGDRLGENARSLFAFEADRAYNYYERARGLDRFVDPVGRPILRAISGVYRALLDEIRMRDYDVLKGRVSLSKRRKLLILARSLGSRFKRAEPAAEPEF